MSTTNYNSSAVGVPYVRANNITIQYPENQIPTVTVAQELAVKLADNTIAHLGPFESITFTLDMVNNATAPVPLVDPTSGAALGPSTNLQSILLGILAIIRQQQNIQNP